MKVGIIELQERLEILEKYVFPIAKNRNLQARRRRFMYCQSGQVERTAARFLWSWKEGGEMRGRRYEY